MPTDQQHARIGPVNRLDRPETDSPRASSPRIASVGTPAFITGVPKFVHTHVGQAGGGGQSSAYAVPVAVSAPTGRQRVAAVKAHHNHSPARNRRPTPAAYGDNDGRSDDDASGAVGLAVSGNTTPQPDVDAVDSSTVRHSTAVRVKLTLDDQNSDSPTDADFWASASQGTHGAGPMSAEFRLALQDWIGVCDSITQTLGKSCKFENIEE